MIAETVASLLGQLLLSQGVRTGQIFATIDEDGSGDLDWAEVEAWVARASSQAEERLLHAIEERSRLMRFQEAAPTDLRDREADFYIQAC